ncbi:MAG: cytochrome P450 [Bdellovibrionales bacterium]|nr:cytochrome P450 [Bdellovibrionales bacterium]
MTTIQEKAMRFLRLCMLINAILITFNTAAVAKDCQRELQAPYKVSTWEFIRNTRKIGIFKFTEKHAQAHDGIFSANPIPDVLRNTISLLSKLPAKLGGQFFTKINDDLSEQPRTFVFLVNGEYIQEALRQPKLTERAYGSLSRTLGQDSLFIKDNSIPQQNEEWQLAHEAMYPYFTKKRVNEEYIPLFERESTAFLQEMTEGLNKQQWENVEKWANYFATKIAAKVLFGYEFTLAEQESLRPIFDDVFRASNSGDSQRIAKVRGGLLDLSMRIILNQQKHNSDNLLQALLTTAAEHQLSDSWVSDQIITLLFAGQETTRSLLAITLHNLAKYPEYQQRLRSEFANASTEVNVLKDLKLHNAFINEVLRLNPPVPAFPRVAVEDISLGNKYLIKKGDVLYFAIQSAHTSDYVWGQDAKQFNPERFLQQEDQQRPEFCPFGYGMRMCIGHLFARSEVIVFLNQFLQQYHVNLVEGHEELKLGHNTGAVLTLKNDFDLKLVPLNIKILPL